VDAQPDPAAERDLFAAEDLTAAEAHAVASADLRAGVAWLAFGVAVLVGSITMDRLQNQHINPYTVPGLLPGCLGIATVLLGALLGIRSWRRGGRFLDVAGVRMSGAMVRRLAVVIGLVVVYSVVLVGHGLPFWLASAIFIVASILLLQRPQRAAAGRRLNARDVLFALTVGLASGWLITLVFQDAFLVRLP